MQKSVKIIIAFISWFSFLCNLALSAESPKSAEELATIINKNLKEQPLDKKPAHARAIPFCGLNKVVIGFAHPLVEYTQNAENAFNFLHEKGGVTKIIRLDPRKSYSRDAFEITEIHIQDWFGWKPNDAQPINPEMYERIWKEIKNTDNMIIGMHCFGGCGRTGTALAALKLRDNMLLCPNSISLTEFGHVEVISNGYGGIKEEQKVYKLVEDSVTFVRKFDEVLNTNLGYQKHSVESVNDARSLNYYLSYLFLSLSKEDRISVDKDGIISPNAENAVTISNKGIIDFGIKLVQ